MFLTSKNWVEVQLLPYQLNSQPCDVGVWSYRTPMVIANSLSTPPAFCTWCPRRHANKGECIARPVSSLRLCHSTTHDGENFPVAIPECRQNGSCFLHISESTQDVAQVIHAGKGFQKHWWRQPGQTLQWAILNIVDSDWVEHIVMFHCSCNTSFLKLHAPPEIHIIEQIWG